MDPAIASAEPAPLDDLSALAWVQQELQRSLDAALKALRRTMREAETIFGGDVEAIDPAVLRGARQHLHQGAGALELIGLPAAAALLRACESAVQRYLPKPHALPPDLVTAIERATFALMDYLARLLAGRPVSALSLYPQYRAVQEGAGAERVHPADLWEIDWQWRELPVDESAKPRSTDAATRSYFEQQLLNLMRGVAKPATRRMSEICAGLGRGAEAPQEATLWKLASAVFEAQSLGVLASDLYSKRVASRLLAQLRSIERGQTGVSERLAQDLVFFCAQAVPPTTGRPAPRLTAARAAYGFTGHVPTDYANSSLGRFDPAWIAQARKRVGATKEAWSQVASGDGQRIAMLGEQMTLLSDSLKRLFAGSDRLAAELQASANPTARHAGPPSAALAMEVATALLYLEASLDDSAFDDPLLEGRLVQLAARVAAAREGGAAQPLERWMEELYRRVSDSQTMGSVVQELRSSLSEVEGQIDRFFRDPAHREVLIPVPNTLGSMRGVLSVLGMDQASVALLRMRDDVEALAATEIDPARGPQAGTFERLADNLGALGFLIDMLGVQPQLAKSLFRYDPLAGTFSPVMGRQPALIVPVHGAAEPGEPPSLDDAPTVPVEPPAPPSVPESDDMRAVFLEEAREVVTEARAGLMAWIGEPRDVDHAAVLRRAFHTLKGSARMVDLQDYGQAGWACEQVMNAHLARQQPADEDLLGFVATALTAFDGWTDAAARGDDSVTGGEALIAEAHALLAKWAAIETGTTAAVEPATSDGVPSPAVGHDGISAIDLPWSAFEPDASTAGTSPVPDLELPSLTSPLDEAPVVPAHDDAEVPTLVATPEPTPEAGIDDDPDAYKQIGPLRIGIPLFNIYLNEADELSRRLSAELGEWSLELHRPPGDDAISLAHSLAGSSATVGFSDLSRLCRSLEHALMRAESVGLADAGEARLFTAVADDVRRLLHQFAAGFLKEPQADLQRRLDELAAAGIPPANEHPTGSDEPVHSVETVEPPVEDSGDGPLLAVDAPSSPELASEPESGAFEHDSVAELASEAELEVSREPTLEADAETAAEPDVDAAPVESAGASDFAGADAFEQLLSPMGELKAYTPLPVATELTPAHHDLPSADDDIDAVDAIDADLFPVFEEEALELLPLIGAKLREWAERPGDVASAAAVMRVLHTLKGGARLSGAMRLGELAHRLEYRIEELLASAAPRSADIDALQMRADRLDQLFEALRTHDAERYAAAIAAAGAPLELQPPAAPEVAAVADSEWPIAERPPSAVALFGSGVAPALSATGESAPIDWAAFLDRSVPARAAVARGAVAAPSSVRVKAPVLDRLVNQIGEVTIARSRLDADVGRLRGHLGDLTDNLDRLRLQLRDIELQAETQMSSQIEAAKSAAEQFDPLEFDRYTRFQELTRMMAESVNDVATVQRSSQRTLESAEDELAALARLTRDLQGDLLRSRMVEFESLSDRLYRVVRQAAKETGKQVRLDLIGGGVEVDRGVLDRMTPAFEHLLRNAMAHGIETPEVREAQGKDPVGTIVVALAHEGNEVAVEFRDDGAGLDLVRIRDRAIATGLATADQQLSDDVLANFIFASGFSTVESVTELAGRGIGMDVVRSEVDAIGGRIETATTQGAGSSFKLILPLTTAVTQVVMVRCGDLTIAVPSTLVEIVRRATQADVTAALASGNLTVGDEVLPFYWLGALLQHSAQSAETGRTRQVLVVRSARQRIALHVDEVLGNQEVVVKNLGPQLSRMPGLAGMTLLTSGAVAPIYNPVALATLYGTDARAALGRADEADDTPVSMNAEPVVAAAPLVLVVDDSLTVRRVTQRLLVREGYRVVLAKDGLDALERLAEERPRVVLSDIEMPRMDGFDLVRNMRADPALRHLPVIMITSRIAHKHREYAVELGVEHYLGKPYAEDELLALVARSAAIERAA